MKRKNIKKIYYKYLINEETILKEAIVKDEFYYKNYKFAVVKKEDGKFSVVHYGSGLAIGYFGYLSNRLKDQKEYAILYMDSITQEKFDQAVKNAEIINN